MNAQAAKAFSSGAGVYPVGSVVVKKKEPQGYWTNDGARKSVKLPDGVGGMIKRAKGYDRDHGDWEYFYFENIAHIESGKINSCVKCHDGGAGKDHVFGSWSKGDHS